MSIKRGMKQAEKETERSVQKILTFSSLNAEPKKIIKRKWNNF